VFAQKVIANTVLEYCELVEVADDDQADLLLLHVNITPVWNLVLWAVPLRSTALIQ
jgi:hypothetical protein